MKVKCEYCGSYVNDTEEKCPSCGAVNQKYQRKAVGTPSTIEELKQWYKEHNLPEQDVTRFFIGIDYKEPRAFGIYKDEATGNFVVYKNKSDGTRNVRYEGNDEAYAVNELYIKLKEEIVNQKNNNDGNKNSKKISRPSGCFIIFMVIFVIMLLMAIFSPKSPSTGYYHYNDNYYYYQMGTWYEYDYYDGWYESDAPDRLEENYSDYYESSSYDDDMDTDDFSETDYYDPSSTSTDSDWDSSSSWDSDSSWDSSSTDWDSDW